MIIMVDADKKINALSHWIYIETHARTSFGTVEGQLRPRPLHFRDATDLNTDVANVGDDAHACKLAKNSAGYWATASEQLSKGVVAWMQEGALLPAGLPRRSGYHAGKLLKF